jgi:hypothetical protein
MMMLACHQLRSVSVPRLIYVGFSEAIVVPDYPMNVAVPRLINVGFSEAIVVPDYPKKTFDDGSIYKPTRYMVFRAETFNHTPQSCFDQYADMPQGN